MSQDDEPGLLLVIPLFGGICCLDEHVINGGGIQQAVPQMLYWYQ